MTPEQLDELNRFIEAPACGGEIYAALLRDAIAKVNAKSSHKGFLEICELATLAYNAGESSAGAIQENPATPLLVNYLLNALRSYRSLTTRNPKAPSSKRWGFLADAFLASGEGHGGSRRSNNWDVSQQVNVYSVFDDHFTKCNEAGAGIEASWKAGFAAAYDYAFGADTLDGREPKQAKKNRALLGALLNDHVSVSTLFKST